MIYYGLNLEFYKDKYEWKASCIIEVCILFLLLLDAVFDTVGVFQMRKLI